MPSDSIESVQTSSPALTSAGRSIGSVTRPSTRRAGAPTLLAASSSEESMPDSAALADEEDNGHGDGGAQDGHARHGRQVERQVQRLGDEIVRVAARPVQCVPAEDEAKRREHERCDQQARVPPPAGDVGPAADDGEPAAEHYLRPRW